MTLEYSDPRYKMRVGRTYFMTSNYKKHVSLLYKWEKMLQGRLEWPMKMQLGKSYE